MRTFAMRVTQLPRSPSERLIELRRRQHQHHEADQTFDLGGWLLLGLIAGAVIFFAWPWL
jgi:hypothetical protein